MATVTIRVDEKTKREAQEVVAMFGFDLSSVTRAFYRQIGRERRVPLTIDQPLPNDETLEALRESDEMIASGKPPRFNTVEEMFESIKG